MTNVNAMPSSSKLSTEEIALAIRVGVPHLGRVAGGIRDFANSKTQWRFLISPETHDLPPESLKGWQGSGVIAQCNTKEEEAILAKLRCPVVNISGVLRQSRFPRVLNDYREIGGRAADYLRERGFQRFGFYGVEQVWYSEEIERGFRESIENFGYAVGSLHSASSIGGIPRWDHGQQDLEAWLLSLQTPFAVLAAHDPRATMVIRACEKVGLRVPEDVAVIGVNDDTDTCETSKPSLTSVRRNGREVGRQAAEMLQNLIAKKTVPGDIIISAGKVRERESTLTLAIDHPALASAVKFVESQFRQDISVTEMAGASGRSRRWLEECFRRELDCSPAEFLKRTRIRAVKEQLRDGEFAGAGQVAAQCGFSGTRQLNAAFERDTGMPLKQYAEAQAADR